MFPSDLPLFLAQLSLSVPPPPGPSTLFQLPPLSHSDISVQEGLFTKWKGNTNEYKSILLLLLLLLQNFTDTEHKTGFILRCLNEHEVLIGTNECILKTRGLNQMILQKQGQRKGRKSVCKYYSVLFAISGLFNDRWWENGITGGSLCQLVVVCHTRRG